MTEEREETKEIDFEADAGESEKDDIGTLSVLSREQLQLESDIDGLNDQIDKKQKELKTVQQERIPRLMQELRLGSFTLDTGEGVSIKRGYFGSIKDNEQEAFAWLEKYDMDDIIKNIVTITFNREENVKAVELFEKLEKMGYDIIKKESIHGGTLKSFIKERMLAKDELEDAWLEKDGMPCDEDGEDWEKYLKFAKEREQEADLTFPKRIFKVFMVDKAAIAKPKKKGRR